MPRSVKPADHAFWTPIRSGKYEGDYAQQDGYYRLARMYDSGGRTAAWVLYVNGTIYEQRTTLRAAKDYAKRVSERLLSEGAAQRVQECTCNMRATDGNHANRCPVLVARRAQDGK